MLLRIHTKAETPTFSCQADKLLSEDDRGSLIDHLAENPLAGDEIPGTGCRNCGFGPQGEESGAALGSYTSTVVIRCQSMRCLPLQSPHGAT